MSSNPPYAPPVQQYEYPQYQPQQPVYGTQPVMYGAPSGQYPVASQQPIPPDYAADNVAPPADYNYNPYQVNYTEMSVDQWEQVPTDPSPYSQYWQSADSYAPENFSKNHEEQKKCNDLVWTIVFLVNFVITIALLIYLCSHTLEIENLKIKPFENKQQVNDMLKCVGIGILVGLVLTVLHFVYASLAPGFYIKFGMIVMLVVTIATAIYAIYVMKNYIFIIFPLLSIVFVILFYCMSMKYIPLTIAVFKEATKLMRHYPSVFLFCFFGLIVDLVVSFIFSLLVYLVQFHNWSGWFYIYLIFSYYYISLTFEYVGYLTLAGLGSTWYFLGGDNPSEYFPTNPLLQSFIRACTTSFGSASLAGLLIAIIEGIKAIINWACNIGQSSGNSVVNCVICLLRCIAMCILNCLERMLTYINRFALIYCATFGVPYMEGARRWAELECKRYVGLLMNSCIVDRCLTYNFFFFSIAGALIGYGIGYGIFDQNATNERVIFACIFSLFFTFGFFSVLEQPLQTFPDTLLVCFAEKPDRLKTTSNELYEVLREKFHDCLNVEVEKQHKS